MNTKNQVSYIKRTFSCYGCWIKRYLELCRNGWYTGGFKTFRIIMILKVENGIVGVGVL